jgi:hypothetical protein
LELEAQRLASLHRGIPASAIPTDVPAAVAMLRADYDTTRRRNVIEDALDDRGSVTYHSIRPEPAEQ